MPHVETQHRPVINAPGRVPVPRTLRELRVARGWKLADLAQASGLHVAVVSQIERGRMAATPDEIAALAAALQLELAVAVMVVHWEPLA